MVQTRARASRNKSGASSSAPQPGAISLLQKGQVGTGRRRRSNTTTSSARRSTPAGRTTTSGRGGRGGRGSGRGGRGPIGLNRNKIYLRDDDDESRTRWITQVLAKLPALGIPLNDLEECKRIDSFLPAGTPDDVRRNASAALYAYLMDEDTVAMSSERLRGLSRVYRNVKDGYLFLKAIVGDLKELDAQRPNTQPVLSESEHLYDYLGSLVAYFRNEENAEPPRQYTEFERTNVFLAAITDDGSYPKSVTDPPVEDTEVILPAPPVEDNFRFSTPLDKA